MQPFSFHFTPAMFAVVFAIAAIIQIIKRIPAAAKYSDWFPLLSCGLGIAGAFQQGIGNPLIAGVIMGTIASGSYSLLKGVVPAPEGTDNLAGVIEKIKPDNAPSPPTIHGSVENQNGNFN